MKKNKKLLAVAAVGAAAILGSALGCGAPDSGGKQAFLKNGTETYAFAAVSGCSLLAMTPGAGRAALSYVSDVRPAATAVEEPDALQEQIDEVNRYLNLFEGMLHSAALNCTVEENQVYKDVSYAVKNTVGVTNLDGTETTYVMYYNETPLNGEHQPEPQPQPDPEPQPQPENDKTQVALTADRLEDDEDDDDEKEEAKDDDEEEETEVETKLEGVLVLGGEDFAIAGSRELEGDEMEVKFVSVKEDGTKMVVEQEVEADEQSFRFKLFDAQGGLVQQSKVELENEQDEVEIKLHLTEDGRTNVYKFEKEIEDGETEIKIHYTVDGLSRMAKVRVVTDETTGEARYEYKFFNGKKQQLERVDLDD